MRFPHHHARRRRGLPGGVVASLLWLCACTPEPAPVQAPPPEPPPPPEPVALEAELQLPWEQRGQAADQARVALEEQRLRLGLSRVEDVQVDLRCQNKQCTATVSATGWP